MLFKVPHIVSKIMLELDPETMVKFWICSKQIQLFLTSPNFESEKFWEKYVHRYQIVYEPRGFRISDLKKTDPDLTWSDLFWESFYLAKHIQARDHYKRTHSDSFGKKSQRLYLNIQNYVENLISKNHLDVLRPYFTCLHSELVKQICYAGSKLANREIIRLTYDERINLLHAFAETTPEGADYFIELGYQPDDEIATYIVGKKNLSLLKHMVSLGYDVKCSLTVAFTNVDFEFIEYLVDDLNCQPNPQDLDDLARQRSEDRDKIINFCLARGYCGQGTNTIFYAIKNDRSDILDCLRNKMDISKRFSKSQWNIFKESAQMYPKVKLWFDIHEST